jgi:hypothetical protein
VVSGVKSRRWVWVPVVESSNPARGYEDGYYGRFRYGYYRGGRYGLLDAVLNGIFIAVQFR